MIQLTAAARSELPAPGLRGARGALAGLVCGTGAVWAHTALSGHAVGLVGVLVVLGSVLACLALARRRLGFPTLLAVTASGQAAAHLAMVVAASTSTAHAGMSHSAGHDMGAMPTSAATSATTGGLGMLLAHATVAVISALLARGGEQALVDLARHLVHRLLPRAPRPLVGPMSRPAPAPAGPLRVRRRVRTPSVLGSRGPPTVAEPSPAPS